MYIIKESSYQINAVSNINACNIANNISKPTLIIDILTNKAKYFPKKQSNLTNLTTETKVTNPFLIKSSNEANIKFSIN